MTAIKACNSVGDQEDSIGEQSYGGRLSGEVAGLRRLRRHVSPNQHQSKKSLIETSDVSVLCTGQRCAISSNRAFWSPLSGPESEMYRSI